MADGKVRIKVEENAKQAERNFSRLDRELKDVSTSAQKADKSFISLKGAITAVAAGVVVRQFAIIGKSAIRAARDAEETANKFGAVFRDITTDAREASLEIEKSFGLSTEATQNFLATTGDLLTGLGFTQEAALDLSDQVTRLAVDLASFTDIEGGAERASAALTSALLGEREAVKSLGIAIGEADIKQLAEEKGIVGNLTRQGKALLTLELATRQSANAIGDFERSQGSNARQVRELEAAIANLSVQIGNELLPVVTDAAEDLTELFNDPEFTEGLANFAGTLAEGAGLAIEFAAALGNLGNTIEGLADKFSFSLLGDEFAEAVERERELVRLQEDVTKQVERLQSGRPSGNQFVDLAADFRAQSGESETPITKAGTDAVLATEKVEKLKKSIQDLSLEERISNEISTTNDIAVDAFSTLADDLAGILVSPFEEGESAAERFGKLALSIIQSVAQEIIRNQLVGLFANIAGSATGGATGGVVASANGNVFQGGNVQPFANGGVVSSPTFFPMANGGTGLMGEAGAEAIMPLKRGKGGRLGVEAEGMTPTINVINNTNSRIETVTRPNNEVDVIVNQVNSVLSSQRSDNAVGAALGRQQTSGVQGF